MEGLTAREWWDYSSPIIITLVFALTVWSVRKNVMQNRIRTLHPIPAHPPHLLRVRRTC